MYDHGCKLKLGPHKAYREWSQHNSGLSHRPQSFFTKTEGRRRMLIPSDIDNTYSTCKVCIHDDVCDGIERTSLVKLVSSFHNP